MAVYTDVAADELAEFLSLYDLGELLSYKGIAEGVENSNFLLHTTRGSYILTLYEKRVEKDDLPFFLGLMTHLAEHGINCPQPVTNRKGEALGSLCGGRRRSSPFSRASGRASRTSPIVPVSARALAKMHLAGRDFAISRANALSVSGWRPLFELAADRADSVQPGLRDFIARELDHLEGGCGRRTCRSA